MNPLCMGTLCLLPSHNSDREVATTRGPVSLGRPPNRSLLRIRWELRVKYDNEGIQLWVLGLLGSIIGLDVPIVRLLVDVL